MGLFDPDPDHPEQLPDAAGDLPRRDPAGVTRRTESRFGAAADERTAVVPAARRTTESDPVEASDPTADLSTLDRVERAKRRMEVLGRNPAADSTQDFPAPTFTDETPIVRDPDAAVLAERAKRRMEELGRNPAADSTQGFPAPTFTDETPIVRDPDAAAETAFVRYDADRTSVLDDPDRTSVLGDPDRTSLLGDPDRTSLLGDPDRTSLLGDRAPVGDATSLDLSAPGGPADTELTLRDPAAPPAAVSAALAAAVLAGRVQRARRRRRVSAIAVLTLIAILGGVTTGYFAVSWFGGNRPQVSSDPDHAPATENPPARSPAPEPTFSDRSGDSGSRSPDNSSASRSPSPKRSSASAGPRPTSEAPPSPKPSHTTSPDPTGTPSSTDPVP